MAKQYFLISPAEYGASDGFDLTYSADQPLPIGSLVQIPLGRRRSLGIVIGKAQKPDFPTKPVAEIFDLPALPPHTVDLARWLSGYYLASPKQVWQTILPPDVSKIRKPRKSKTIQFSLPKMEAPLTPEQAIILTKIEKSAKPVLIRGVTGAGKTQVYIELAKQATLAGQSAVILVPEITLTHQVVARFQAVFGERVVTRHSRMTPAQRYAAWHKCLVADQPLIVIGPRSSLFLPLRQLGLIVIDEVHDSAYKQEQAPRYNADAVAAKLAGLTGAKLVMGSATPSLNHLYLAERGRLELTEMTSRANLLPAPETEIIDLRDKSQLKQSRFLSRPLIKAITQTLAENRQVLLFLNRRGSASAQICGSCGQMTACPHCQIAMTFHADRAQLVCHYCNFSQIPSAVCPNCHQAEMTFIGGGTKRIETEAAKLFPAARIARLDTDSAKPSHIEQVHRQMHAGELDILVGTQMIAKGLDMPAIDLVGVVSADTMLAIPDFTAAERTFQLLAQVAGRTSRGERAGKVMVQTYSPDHPAITSAAGHDFWQFAKPELAERQQLNYPPYVYLLQLTCQGKTADAAQAKAAELAEQLKKINGISITGPAPAFRELAGGKYHWQLIIRSKSRAPLLTAAKQAGSGWTVNLDPVNLL